jgi:N-methylhydantoinase B
MGIALQRAAFSPNITMRRDFSCAVFDDGGRLLAQAAHIPVHLGAMGRAMESVLKATSLEPGDVVVMNDPFAGGTHLPDISFVSAAYSGDDHLGYIMSRAHHSDVGGMTPGSMPLSADIFQEGLIVPPVKLIEGGHWNQDAFKLLLRNVRTPDEREGDLLAQLAAQRAGEARFGDIAREYGAGEIRNQAAALLDYSELMVRALIRQLPRASTSAEDWLDDGGLDQKPVRIHVTIAREGESDLSVDFSKSARQVVGPVNAVRPVTESALLYVLRTLLSEDVPVNAGMLRPVRLATVAGTVVDASPPAAVSAGNVETSQRIVDALYRALAGSLPHRVPAASQGTMNNVAFGGFDGGRSRQFTYYETMGGGMGARPDDPGMNGVHDHMSNTLNTPVETLEMDYPVRVLRYELRPGSGGRGEFRGGDGLRRDIEFLAPATVSIISERRSTTPYGLHGGLPGITGENTLTRAGQETVLPGKTVLSVEPGDVVSIRTPGGGGIGRETERDQP